jgi:polyhydroxyalkanoate synthesis repressor PhaR
MTLIKRYPNRKLYDTETRRYITLEGIAALIRQGQEVSVVDHATGEDLTALTLSQIIFEQEKRQSGFLPRAVLTGLIQAGGETLGTLQRTLAASLGLGNHVDAEIERRVQLLIRRGELDREVGLRLLALGRRPLKLFVLDEGAVERLLLERGLPTRDDLQRLNQQLDALAAKLDQISQNGA